MPRRVAIMYALNDSLLVQFSSTHGTDAPADRDQELLQIFFVPPSFLTELALLYSSVVES